MLVRLTVDAIKILWPHKLLRVRSGRRRGVERGAGEEWQITIQQIKFNRTRKRSKSAVEMVKNSIGDGTLRRSPKMLLAQSRS